MLLRDHMQCPLLLVKLDMRGPVKKKKKKKIVENLKKKNNKFTRTPCLDVVGKVSFKKV